MHVELFTAIAPFLAILLLVHLVITMLFPEKF